MKIPDFLNNQKYPSLDEAIIELLDSIAKEERALSKLVSSEAKKVTFFTGEDDNFPTCTSNQDIVAFSRSLNNLIDSVLMKEWLLFKKFETVISIKERSNTPFADHFYWEKNWEEPKDKE